MDCGDTCLTQLDMSSNYIGEEGADVLAEMLGRNTTLTTFDLTENNFGAEGAGLLGQAMTHNSTLVRLAV